MRYTLDTEFIEDGSTIDLISIGMVAEDGREFYACSTEARLDRANDWVRSKVLPSLPRYGHHTWMSRSEILLGVLSFVQDAGQDPNSREPANVRARNDAFRALESRGMSSSLHQEKINRPDLQPEFWAYFADYDWVVFCQLFGRMIDLPDNFPKFCMDLKQWANQIGLNRESPEWPVQSPGLEHDALEDARHNARLYNYLARSCGKAPGFGLIGR